ncbi:lipopolysaccharide biosynthesis protein [Nocardioides sp. SYSU DS0651]|uniref:lipopolysaccharide biosynthesis protein n=1 Tax=Nocardioides sp. SYSU DS0651 TaxID=3415955 RepID=UPI003F4C72A7
MNRTRARLLGRLVSSPVAVASLVPALSAAVAFVANVLIARALGPEARGAVALTLQVGYFASPLIILGRDRGVLRGERTVPLVSGPAVVIALVIAVPFMSEVLWLAAPAAWISAHATMARAEALSRGRINWYLAWSALFQCTILVGNGVLFLLDVRETAWWLLPYTLPALAIAIWELTHVARRGRAAFQRGLAFLHLAPAAVASLVVLRSERLLLPIIATTNELGYYVAVATATEPIAWLAQARADRHTSQEGQGTRRALARSAREQIPRFAAASAVLGLIAFVAVVPLLGPAFAPARWLVPPLTLAAVTLVLYRLAMAQLLASRRPSRSSLAETLTAILALAVYAAAIWLWGMHGAAWASAAVYGMGAAIAARLLPPTSSITYGQATGRR